ncbi:MAG: T9SS type A sorting domain-containing protein [Saprospiraceae bacterium]|nr:T9SS type A sorting domain-containing protein [Saprospiraceae bacterium]
MYIICLGIPVIQIIINQGDQTDMLYTLYDVQGRMIRQLAIADAHQGTIWDISALPGGLYILSVSHKGKLIKSVRMVVE